MTRPSHLSSQVHQNNTLLLHRKLEKPENQNQKGLERCILCYERSQLSTQDTIFTKLSNKIEGLIKSFNDKNSLFYQDSTRKLQLIKTFSKVEECKMNMQKLVTSLDANNKHTKKKKSGKQAQLIHNSLKNKTK